MIGLKQITSSLPYLFIVGSGPWAKKIELVLSRSSLPVNFRRVEARRFIEVTSSQNLDDSIIWLATRPKLQLALLETLSPYKARILIDKPVVSDFSSLNHLKELETRSNSKLRIVQTWRCSQLWKISSSPLKDLHSIKIVRQYTDTREYISPALDWLPHDFSLLSDLGLRPSNLLLDDFNPGEGMSFNLKARIPSGSRLEISIIRSESRTSHWTLTHRTGSVRAIDFDKRHSTLSNSNGEVLETWNQPTIDHPIINVISQIDMWGASDFQKQLEYYDWYFKHGGV